MSNKKGIVHFFPLLAIALLAIGFLVTTTTFTRVSGSESQKGLVLKDSDESEDEPEEEKEEEDRSGSNSGSEDRDDSSDENDEHEGEDSNHESEDETEDENEIEIEDEDEDNVGVRLRTESKDDEEKYEIRFSETERVKVKTKDGERTIDVYQGGIKVRFEYRNGELRVNAETEDDDEYGEIESDELFKIVESLDESDIKISTDSGRIALTRGNSKAVTNFPLSIDMDTNSLIVTTPSGEKTVTVLPDVAIQNLIAANTISRVSDDAIEIEETDEDETVYVVNGISDQRLLGLIPVTIEKEIEVSIENGEKLTETKSFINRILDFISF